MYYAHMPAGYITSKLLIGRFSKYKVSQTAFILSGVIGSIAPDFDIIYYVFFPHYQGHHAYITHFPGFWLTLLFVAFVWLGLNKKHHQAPVLAVIFTFNGFVHLFLDTLVGHIYWMDKNKPFSLSGYVPWDAGFLELFVFLWAIYLWKKNTIVNLLSDTKPSQDGNEADAVRPNSNKQ